MDDHKGDEEYVKLVMADSVARKRVTRDRFKPNDKSRVKYWVLNDEAKQIRKSIRKSKGLLKWSVVYVVISLIWIYEYMWL